MVTSISGDNLCEISSCSPNPCANGGTCQLDESAEGGYSCSCPEGYTGVDCTTDIDECLTGKWEGVYVFYTMIKLLKLLQIRVSHLASVQTSLGPSSACVLSSELEIGVSIQDRVQSLIPARTESSVWRVYWPLVAMSV